MRFTSTLCTSLVLTAALCGPATAQHYLGDDVTVNNSAPGLGYLLYPGGMYGRSVRALRQPGEHTDGRIHLHMPSHHHLNVAATTTKPVRIASIPAPRKPETPMTKDLTTLPEDSAARLVGPQTLPVAPPPHLATKPPRPAAHPEALGGATSVPFAMGYTARPPVATKTPRMASATPPAAVTPSAAVAAGLRKQTSIPFAIAANSPTSTEVEAIHTLASSLNAALSAGATKIQLNAYGGPPGDKSSDSRRTSLKRALVVRELLIEDGVPSEKIDVRAMGGVDDGGAADRVDVFVRS